MIKYKISEIINFLTCKIYLENKNENGMKSKHKWKTKKSFAKKSDKNAIIKNIISTITFLR